MTGIYQSSVSLGKRTLIFAKRIFNPFGCSVVAEGYNIKTTVNFVGELMMLQIKLRGFNNFTLLGKGYALSSIGKLAVTAQTHLNKHQGITLLHYQVDLASFAAVIFCANYQPLLL